jgi:hypothetical protein
MELLWELAGWGGAAAILGAYLTVSMGWLKPGRGFHITNLLGAAAFVVNGAFHQAWPSVVTNVAWFLISAIALLRMCSVSQQVAPTAESMQIQFPGVPDTTGQIAVVEPHTGPIHPDAEKQRLTASTRNT